MKTKPKIKTPPPGSINAIVFSDIFTLHEIQHLQDLFANATGVASIITHPDGTPITKPSNFCRLCNDIIRKTEKGRANCFLSDSVLGQANYEGPIVQPCLSCELWDAGTSIVVGGKHIANWLIGQVRNEESDEQRMIEYADEIGANREDFMNALKEVPVMSVDQFQKVSKMLFAFVKELSEKAYNNLQLKIQIAERELATTQISTLHAKHEKNELFLKETQKIAHLGTYLLNIEAGIWTSSEILDEIFGIPTDFDKSVQGWASVIHPEWQQIMTNYFANDVIGNKGRFDKEYKIIKQNSREERWVHGLGEVSYNDAGQPLTMIGTIMDITLQKKSEETISMLAHAIRSISECVSITDMNDQIIFVNTAFLKTYQYEEHELLGKSITMVRSPNNSPAIVMEILPATMHGGWHGEIMNQRKDGSEFPVFVSSTVIHNENNEPLALIGVTTDISERKKAEREILELNEALDHRVKIRTEELEAANKELETFSYSVSHDLKTPLRHITGFINLIIDNNASNLTEKDHVYLNSIASSANEMTQLIDAILSFSKLNLAELRKTKIHSSKMVHQVINFFEPEIQYRKITFNVDPLPDVHGDEGLIRQVWTNLLSNAIKYSSKKADAVINIGSTSTDDATTFFINDNGAGFNMKYADKLFGVFHRLHKSRDFEGIGIGLANVNRILTRHGGHCRAEGEPGVGATFYFTLPNPQPTLS